MQYNMYSVKDELTGRFMNPIYVEQGEYADSMAIRQFKSQINNIQLWKDNANDYNLYLVGTFDEEEGAAATSLTKVTSGRSVLEWSELSFLKEKENLHHPDQDTLIPTLKKSKRNQVESIL